jgi:hypothetical protein
MEEFSCEQASLLETSVSPSSLPSTTSSSSLPRVKGKNWSIEEDVQLCLSWCHITQDPLKGTEQKYNELWERITEHFNTNRNSEKVEVRTVKSCSQRYYFKY